MRFYFRTALFLSQIKKKSDVTMLVKIIVMLKLGSESLRVHLNESPKTCPPMAERQKGKRKNKTTRKFLR
ncbi:MAG: hypothetical protein II811_01235, partial [Spirochaetaceae bacterium]|nr:hypothetical protein [Spirochaetaceae bacterium]